MKPPTKRTPNKSTTQELVAALHVMVFRCMVLAGISAKTPKADCHSSPCQPVLIAESQVMAFRCMQNITVDARFEPRMHQKLAHRRSVQCPALFQILFT